MAVGIHVQVKGSDRYQRMLKEVNPQQRKKIQSLGLRAVAFEVGNVAKLKKIKRLNKKSAPLTNKLTSRTNVGVDSISTDFSKLPGKSLVGSHLKYMAMHEKGGTFSVKRHSVAEHKRRKAFGKTFKAFTVPKHSRGPHKVKFRPRPWVQPSIDAVVPKRAEAIFIKFWEKQIKGAK